MGKFVFTNAVYGDLKKHKKNRKHEFGVDAHVGLVMGIYAGKGGEMEAHLEEWQIAADEDGDVPNTFVRVEEEGGERWMEPVGALYYAHVLAPRQLTSDGKDELIELDVDHMNMIGDGELQRMMDRDAGLSEMEIEKAAAKRQRHEQKVDSNKENATTRRETRKRKPTTETGGSALRDMQNTLRQSKFQRLRKAQHS